MRLGFVLATCELSDLELCARLAHAALHAGHQVELFLMHEAVRFAARPELGALVEAGVDVTGCATSALRAAMAGPADRRHPELHTGSQLDHAALVRRCDRVLTLA